MVSMKNNRAIPRWTRFLRDTARIAGFLFTSRISMQNVVVSDVNAESMLEKAAEEMASTNRMVTQGQK